MYAEYRMSKKLKADSLKLLDIARTFKHEAQDENNEDIETSVAEAIHNFTDSHTSDDPNKSNSMDQRSAELVETLFRIAVKDDSKESKLLKIVNAGALPNLVAMLRNKDEDKQEKAAELVWSLSFDPDVKKKIEQEPGCMEALESLSHKSRNPAVKRQASGALWKLQEEKHKKDPTEVQSKTTDGHIMISYNWENQAVMMQLNDRLKAAGYTVWIDVEQMGGSTLDAMAHAVENAACVLVGVSEKYKLSPNCRTEGEYTFQLKKPRIPLMMQRHYKPDGWLGMLCGTQMYVNFDGKYEFDHAFSLLLEQLDRTLKQEEDEEEDAEEENGAIEPQQSQTTGAAIPTITYKEWTNRRVRAWAKKNNLNGSSHFLQEMTGAHLDQLCEMKSQAPEFFYSHMANKENMKLLEILQLTKAMGEL